MADVAIFKVIIKLEEKKGDSKCQSGKEQEGTSHQEYLQGVVSSFIFKPCS